VLSLFAVCSERLQQSIVVHPDGFVDAPDPVRLDEELRQVGPWRALVELGFELRLEVDVFHLHLELQQLEQLEKRHSVVKRAADRIEPARANRRAGSQEVMAVVGRGRVGVQTG
jgi:hypothetical protein